MTWYELEVTGRQSYRLWIKWWHPGFWREGYCTLRNSGSGVLSSIFYTLVLVFQMAKRKH